MLYLPCVGRLLFMGATSPPEHICFSEALHEKQRDAAFQMLAKLSEVHRNSSVEHCICDWLHPPFGATAYRCNNAVAIVRETD